MDPQVQSTQRWLNSTYGAVSGWVPLSDDGITGWATIYGLRRALQVELGVSPISSGFGSATSTAFVNKVNRINDSTTNKNLLLILSGALWCKGYAGLYAGETVAFSNLSFQIGLIRADLGFSSSDRFVDVKLMASLLSMDAYTKLSGGDSDIRTVQRGLNGLYSQRRDFAIVPCDGLYSRQVQTALLYAVQYELGMADGVANGNFGTGTKDGIRQSALVSQGMTDASKRFVRTFQSALTLNKFTVPYSGTFDADTATATRQFQAFMELPTTGSGDYQTWCSLLASSGDTAIATKGFDTNQQLQVSEASGAVKAGYTVAGRYLVGSNKFITTVELRALKASGIGLLAIFQRLNNSPDVMTRANGRLHAIEAIERARVLDLPVQSHIFFAVDFDATSEAIEGPVCDYFQGIADVMATCIDSVYKVGIYGTRNVCGTVIGRGLASGAFVAGMSTGWSGNMGFRMPTDWHYNQILETSAIFAAGGRSIGIDKVVVSSRAAPTKLSAVSPPPVETDGSVSATGFDAFFEWLVRGEVAIERAIASQSSSLRPWNGLSFDFISHWLRKSKYWTGSRLWQVYTPLNDPNDSTPLARTVAENALDALSPLGSASARDIPHFAATLRGYLTWGLPKQGNTYNWADLGGWGLDLLSVFGAYERSGSTDLAGFAAAEVGKAGTSSVFSRADVIADADAYLWQRRMVDRGAKTFSAVGRDLLQASSTSRIGQFYFERFDKSPGQVVQAFTTLADGLEVGSIENIVGSKQVLLAGANATRLPNPTEATVLAEAYAAYLAR